ncbi:MAG: phospholipid carrier-dependent glycosyltransferase [Chloroflexi bacterium]|nr:phospholipid carrier-dependent glycosyltransferase [Chloroflexota bacterium]
MRRFVVPLLVLLALAAYIFAGMPLASFHGDEAMHIYTSRDYATVFLEGRLDTLPVSPPYPIDADNRLRLLNGSVARYSIGLSWHLAGLNTGDLPPAPGWDWGLQYARNVETGHRPSEALLLAGRRASTLFLALSVVVVFGLGRRLGGLPLAYVASILYAVNPVLLLNGRRSLVEGALLFFGLLTLWVGVEVAHRLKQERPGTRGVLLWLALAAASALALASKYSAATLVAAVYGGIGLAALQNVLRSAQPWRSRLAALARTGAALLVCGLLALALFLALSPALWNDPAARLGDLAAALQEQIDIVVDILPDAPTGIAYRIQALLTQPFMTAPAHFEQASWAEAAPITAEIAAYMASPLSGLQFGLLLGLPLTLLAGAGLLAAAGRVLHAEGASVVLLTVLALLAISLLANPLPWQRYYLLWLPVITLLAGVGLLAAWRGLSTLVRSRRVGET